MLSLLLQGRGQKAHADAVAANVALLMKIHGQENLRHNTQQALETIHSGRAYERVTALAARS